MSTMWSYAAETSTSQPDGDSGIAVATDRRRGHVSYAQLIPLHASTPVMDQNHRPWI